MTLILVSLVRTLYQTYSLSSQQRKLEQEIADLQKGKVVLQKTVTQRQSQEYIEKEARDKLLMTKAGETLVVLPSPIDTKEGNPFYSLGGKNNPQKWLNVFFGRPWEIEFFLSHFHRASGTLLALPSLRLAKPPEARRAKGGASDRIWTCGQRLMSPLLCHWATLAWLGLQSPVALAKGGGCGSWNLPPG